MRALWQDIRFAARVLLGKPGFTIAVVLCLSLGIGVTTSVFGMIGTAFLRPLVPLKNPHRLVTIYSVSDEGGYFDYENPGINYLDWKAQNESFESMAALADNHGILRDHQGSLQGKGLSVTPDAFEVLGLDAFMGRTFLPSEIWPGPQNVIVLSHALWSNRYDADPGIIGQSVTLGDHVCTVVGVMPPDVRFFHFGVESSGKELDTNDLIDYWLPVSVDIAHYGGRSAYNWHVIARLRTGVTIVQAQAEMNTIAGRIRHEYPDSARAVQVVPLQKAFGRAAKYFLYLLFGAAVFVLLIGCVNLVNLFLVQTLIRERELSIRAALGAGRGRLIRQLLTESLLIAVPSGFAGLALSVWLTGIILSTTSVGIPRLDGNSVSRHAVGFAVCISLVAGCILGLVSASQAFVVRLSDSLKEGGWTATAGIGRRRLTSVLVGLAFSLTLILLIGASLLVNSFLHAMHIELGYSTRNLLTMKIDGASPIFTGQLLERVKVVSGVQAVTVALGLPLCGGDRGCNLDRVAGAPTVRMHWVTPGYFRMMGIDLMQGRDFSDTDNAAAYKVTIVGERFARQIWPHENPVGKRFKHYGLTGDDRPYEIIGVARDGKSRIDGDRLDAYACHLQESLDSYHLAIRTASDPMSLIEPIRNEIEAIDKYVSVSDVKTMDERFSEFSAGPRFLMTLLVIFSAVGIVFAMTGIYGTVAYSVSRRTHEVGIRMAMGASRNEILQLVLRQGLVIILAGSVIGLMGAFALTRLIASLLYGVTATDPWTYGGVTLALAIVALLACLVPARRAARIDPMAALRCE